MSPDHHDYTGALSVDQASRWSGKECAFIIDAWSTDKAPVYRDGPPTYRIYFIDADAFAPRQIEPEHPEGFRSTWWKIGPEGGMTNHSTNNEIYNQPFNQ